MVNVLRAGRGVLVGGFALSAAGAAFFANCAFAATSATIAPRLEPPTPGSRTTIVVSASFSGGEGALPSPLTALTVFIPQGLIGERTEWPTTLGCAAKVLLKRGPSGCPPRSQIGSGSALLAAEVGGRIEKVPAKLSVFVGPTNGPYVLEVVGQTAPPLAKRFVFTEEEAVVTPPFSAELHAKIPPLELGHGLPPASVLELTTRVGEAAAGPSGVQRMASARRLRRRHPLANRPRKKRHKVHKRRPSQRRKGPLRGEFVVYNPPRCPAGGYHWEATFGFADGSSQTVSAVTTCP